MHRLPVAIAFLAPLGCVAPDPAGPRAPRPFDSPAAPVSAQTIEAQAKAYAVASRPVSAHQALEPLLGEWEVELSAITADGSTTEPFRGRATLAWTLGGRFLRWDAGLRFGDTPGATTGFLGFNTRTRRYQLMMISDLATGMVIAEGNGDLRGAGIHFEIEELDADTGARLVAKSRIRLITPEHFVLEQLEPGIDGRDRVVRVSHYRRPRPPTR